ncbi:MAG: glycoside hydrolase [Candidatus Raymondbacteria bacterium RifOxyC12_full_50_8]|uniref:Glycoside hydrolase n=1 Tax=Candidatus Raymondbacteria bacterium RIFOXYD12_FULL_49_13 TaxID=1817890 RepID=A0A1F7FFB0_UNCRA|nr:MAG: glycoside hydrolase [Candidatus Raymondbacteria bacterium RIFOXYA2_FULL_49_16]OGJ94604.1 MAG: glycoside hydrolase [Candidatus Raymondbacteria bacterium RifOxyB12_full_50_8]OGJ98874.1 MAG: glycoside hydrolase [Candidatus Raymondbacteria bacterium RifOxyC12_full_50_8]OGK05375.1 MAG: glycoside hydrolase [Candidatus Raymondbacteria bacterium RIFOXYD12_FULL_49_13]OGP42988.1 MAG: glycoside hydrolase [Candidatus Raymondbacteria bacterium RIFOXYB2_FULL_49_35]
MSLKKEPIKGKPQVKVTFTLPKELTESVKSVALVGDFNEWNPKTTAMKKLPRGGYYVSLNLQKGRNYQFRYLLDGGRWLNDPAADAYAFSSFAHTDNCVVTV